MSQTQASSVSELSKWIRDSFDARLQAIDDEESTKSVSKNKANSTTADSTGSASTAKTSQPPELTQGERYTVQLTDVKVVPLSNCTKTFFKFAAAPASNEMVKTWADDKELPASLPAELASGSFANSLGESLLVRYGDLTVRRGRKQWEFLDKPREGEEGESDFDTSSLPCESIKFTGTETDSAFGKDFMRSIERFDVVMTTKATP